MFHLMTTTTCENKCKDQNGDSVVMVKETFTEDFIDSLSRTLSESATRRRASESNTPVRTR